MHEPGSTCPHCGHTSEALAGLVRLVYVTELSVDLLSKLFRGELDNHLCEACAQPLGIQPTVAFRSVEPNALHQVEGRPATDQDDLVNALLDNEEASGNDVPIVLLPSLDDLRQLVATLLRENLGPLLRAFGMGPGPLEGDALSARSFAAALVALGTPSSGIEINVRQPDGTLMPKAQLLERAAAIQAGSWTGIVRNWVTETDHDTTLEEDLAQHCAEGVLLPGADDQALAALDEIVARKSLPLPHRYCLEATRASVCAVAKRPNPSVDAWIQAFLEIELESRAMDTELVAAARPLLISSDRARATIPFEDVSKAMRSYVADAVKESDQNYLDALSAIAEKCGYPTLVSRIFEESGRLESAEKLSADDMIGALRAAAMSGGLAEVISLATVVCRPLIDRGDFAELERVGAAIAGMMGDTPEAMGRVDVWMASGLAKMGYPTKIIDRIGPTPRPWELPLPFDVRTALWNLRARALDRLERYYESLDQIDDLLRMWPEEPTSRARRDAVRFCCELLQATGEPALAIQRLEHLRQQTSGEEQMLVLQSLMRGYRSVGRSADAIRCGEQALLLATGSLEPAIPHIKVSLALDLALAGLYEAAAHHLTELGEASDSDMAVLFVAASAWIIILGQQPSAPAQMGILIAQSSVAIGTVHQALWKVAERALQHENGSTLLAALRFYTTIAHVVGLPEVHRHWKFLCEMRGRFLQAPSAVEILALADLAYEAGKVAVGRQYLSQVPLAMAASLPGASRGGVRGLGHLAARSQGLALVLNALLDRVTSTVLEKGSARTRRTTVEDLRLIVELRREALGRAQDVFRAPGLASDLPVIRDGVTDAVLARLAPSAGRLAVVECVRYRDGTIFLIAVIDAAGGVTSRVVASPQPDLTGLAKRIRQRLSGWRSGRAGDPFDLPAWQSLEIWLCELLAEHLADGDHVVFIEPVGLGGLPWHVAVARQWTASYTTSWTRLLSFGTVAASGQPVSVGVAHVPQFNESDNILRAMRRSAERTRTLAAARGFRYVESAERQCDRRALMGVLASTTTAKLLCHGFVSPAEHEAALMLAHDGALPLGIKVSTDSEMARAHRFSWRDCRALARAPSVVFSAACSTGISHVLGLGEHVGLFAGLTSAGTRAMVAPRWDVVAASVLPILDDALECYLTGGVPVGAAVHAACRRAEPDTPRWLAWALATEGDWTCLSHSTNS
jgi:tetratricopeptide (TPR) repeat protein